MCPKICPMDYSIQYVQNQVNRKSGALYMNLTEWLREIMFGAKKCHLET